MQVVLTSFMHRWYIDPRGGTGLGGGGGQIKKD